MRRWLATSFFALLVLVGLEGCATAAKPQAMTVQPRADAAVNPRLKGAITVGEVTGGKKTNPLWTSQVDSEAFRQALDRSLAIAGYLAPPGTAGAYVISAALEKLEQPFIGVTFDVTASVTYRLTGEDATRDFPVTVTGSATLGDAWVGAERLRLANENAINANIKELLRQLEAF
jgi:hypothetical protein